LTAGVLESARAAARQCSSWRRPRTGCRPTDASAARLAAAPLAAALPPPLLQLKASTLGRLFPEFCTMPEAAIAPLANLAAVAAATARTCGVELYSDPFTPRLEHLAVHNDPGPAPFRPVSPRGGRDMISLKAAEARFCCGPAAARPHPAAAGRPSCD
jgi:hypothetical protein